MVKKNYYVYVNLREEAKRLKNVLQSFNPSYKIETFTRYYAYIDLTEDELLVLKLSVPGVCTILTDDYMMGDED